ncbi:aminomethyl-transferring glycine dehydrogenase subunit GcvPA [Solihabitans fulvus]|uniref:Aminomethyl-transferring glycine dehydrogenase subunit GcvPA n=1 Tax=Solihabitans fulvus TaxID=1892852 RepID=A0A5B2XEK4_9PSEU|nr:aminomethyl-transferring glycine dehydrogenase subunit GcvPA [Solihabitans fulvus]KAA2261475.1 aminomethyl-transferring glycine dehydrogenase subunit GcvPA [Solihabitans fulvus]
MAHPYIPNSVPAVRERMLKAVGAASVEEFYADIPESIRLRRPLDLPAPLRSEAELVRHLDGLLARNTPGALSFLGAGCYQHHVPAVVDEVATRSEFLTAYAGEPYEDHGRFQALWEYQSLMGELLELDVVNVPTYDGFQATGTALRMAGRVTGRRTLLIVGPVDPDKLSKIADYVRPDHDVVLVDAAAVADLDLSADVAAVYCETPNYHGILDASVPALAARAHAAGALLVAGCNPISLGVVAPPSAYGADIVCGDIQPLGIRMSFGGGNAGFIATRDDPRLVSEFPSRLFGVIPTTVEGEYGFGDVDYERTSFAVREEGKEWVGTAAALHGIMAGVYLALMGPQGMREIGETILANTAYAQRRLAEIPGVEAPSAAAGQVSFADFLVRFTGSLTAAEVNTRLLALGIHGGKVLSATDALYCVTEIHTREDIDRLAQALEEITA